MSTTLSTLEVTLPPAASQFIEHAKRVITIHGSAGQDGSQDVAVSYTGPLTVKAATDAQVTIGVSEVLANGKTHAPVTITVTPHSLIEPIAPDAAGFSVKVVGVEPVAAPQPPAAPAGG